MGREKQPRHGSRIGQQREQAVSDSSIVREAGVEQWGTAIYFQTLERVNLSISKIRCGGLIRKGCGVWFVPASETSVLDGRFSNVTDYSRLMTREYIERSQADSWDSAPTRTPGRSRKG